MGGYEMPSACIEKDAATPTSGKCCQTTSTSGKFVSRSRCNYPAKDAPACKCQDPVPPSCLADAGPETDPENGPVCCQSRAPVLPEGCPASAVQKH